MPAKKGGNTDIGGTNAARTEHASVSPPLSESSDPVAQAVGIVDRKVRNIEKRKVKLESLQQLKNDGKELDRDQLDAVSKLKEVIVQLELAKELQKQFVTFNESYQKSKKKQQKAEKQQQREAEREAQKSALAYSVRVQNLLTGLDEVSKPDFKKGTNGAVQLTDAELTQLDDLYQLLVPTRMGNADYQQEVESVGEHFLLLQEQSTKEVVGTTYKELYSLLQKLDSCSYFDSIHNEDDVLSIGGGDDYKSTEDGLAEEEVAAVCEQEPDESTPQEPQPLPQPVEPIVTQPFVAPQVATVVPPQAVVPQPAPAILLQSFAPSAPSPTFPALAVNVGLTNSDATFSFMHKSEIGTQGVTFNDSQQTSSSNDHTSSGVPSSSGPSVPQSKLPQQAPASQDTASVPNVTGMSSRETEGKSNMDASTGQLSPTQEGENSNAFQQQAGRNNRGGGTYSKGQGGSQFRRGGGGSRGGFRSGDRYYDQPRNQQSYNHRGPSSRNDGYQSNKGSSYQGRGGSYSAAPRENGSYSGGRGNGRGGRPNYTEKH